MKDKIIEKIWNMEGFSSEECLYISTHLSGESFSAPFNHDATDSNICLGVTEKDVEQLNKLLSEMMEEESKPSVKIERLDAIASNPKWRRMICAQFLSNAAGFGGGGGHPLMALIAHLMKNKFKRDEEDDE